MAQASTIRCQRQSLGEDLTIAGTPYSLHYESDRQHGRLPELQVPLSGASLVGSVLGITLQVNVAGRKFVESFPAQPNQTTTFSWDGTDAYGRLLQGGQPIAVNVANVYQGVYQNVDLFGLQGNGVTLSVNTRKQVALGKSWNGTIDLWDAKSQGLGGWDLDIHHTLDLSGRTLRFGDGSNLTPANIPAVIQTVAGNGSGAPENMDDGQPATSVLMAPASVAIGPDGSIYIADDSRECIRRVTPDGIIHTFAGKCQITGQSSTAGFSGDGGPATAALLHAPEDIAFGPDGSLYIADSTNERIRRVYPNGIIQTVAGSGPTGTQPGPGNFSGDGGPATQAVFNQPLGVDVAPDGTLYIVDLDNQRVRRVSPDGTVTTVAGNGVFGAITNEVPATSTGLSGPQKVRVGPDGSLYIAEFNNHTIRRVSTDGIIHAFAGPGTGNPGDGNGGPATAATLDDVEDVALGPDGSVYVLDQTHTVRRVDPSGIISTVAGTTAKGGFSGDGGLATLATMGISHGIRVGPDGSLYIACSIDDRVRRVQSILTGFSSGAATLQFPSNEGKQVYVFDSTGRHLQTLDAFTKATLYQFGYDSGGRVATVTDVNGQITQINHDASGNLTSLVGPFGEQTTFTPDANGYLATSMDPAGQVTQFAYDANGLMLSKTNPRGGPSEYSYDSLGRLSEDQDPAGGSKTLTRSDATTGFTVTSTTALNRKTSYQTTTTETGTLSRQNTFPDGLQGSLQFTPSGVTTVTVPDGTTTSTSEQPDPRLGFGMFSPVPTVTTKTPSGLTSTQTTTRSVTLSGSNLATFTEQTNLNGNTWTRLFNVSTSTWTTTSPAGRVSTTTVDAAERPTQVSVANVAPFTFAYDSHGRLSTATQATHVWTQGYDSQGYLASSADPLNHATSYVNDPVGRPTQTMLADGRLLGTAYDGDSNTTQVTLPSGELHDFTFTPVDLLASYEPPSVSSASPSTQYFYDLDRELQTVTRPDGVTLAYGYDFAGRLQTTTIPQGTVTLTYNPTTGQLQSSTAPSGEAIGYAFDGFLKTGETWSGPVPGTLSLGFDNNFRMTSQTVNGTALGFGYDLDGLLTGAGALTLTRDPQNGRLTGTTLGLVTDSYGYDSNGLFASYTAAFSGTTLYSESRAARRAGADHAEDRDGAGHDARVGVHVRRAGSTDGRDRRR